MTDPKEIGDSLAMEAGSAHYVGRYAEAERHATACIERSRGIDSGSYVHGLIWRVLARFMLGDWDGALADQAELERLAALDPREFPPAFTMRAYSLGGLCHELRGERDDADRYVDLGLRYLATASRSVSAPLLARVLAFQERYDEAVALCRYIPRTQNAAVVLETLCEIAGLRDDWDGAHELVAQARAEAEHGELLALRFYADRLEGRAAASVPLLRRSAEGFAALGARWEEARSRLLLAELLSTEEPSRAEREL
jgi:hypothetical protein